MELILYKTVDAKNVINKTLTNQVSLKISLKRDVDIIFPEIVLNGDYRGFNYAKITELNRFYFVETVEQLNLKMVKLSLVCDVLETYKSIILNSDCTYKAKVNSGDYGQIDLDVTGKTLYKNYLSSVTPELSNNIILTTLKG